MKNVAIYPFCAELLPIARHFNQLQSKYNLKRVISPSGLGIVGRDAGYTCNHNNTGMIVTKEISPDDLSWEILLLTRVMDSRGINDAILVGALEKALQADKSVVYFDNFADAVPSKVYDIAGKHPNRVIVRSSDMCNEEERGRRGTFSLLETPVVFIGGVLAQADVLDVLFGLAEHIRIDGLHPLVITSHPMAELFGFHSINHIFEKKYLTEAEMILEMNLLIKNLEHTEVPDVILVQAPDAVMRFNDYDPNGFGIRSYMITQAAQPDYFVCCVPFELANRKFLDMMSADLSYRLGCPIHAAHASNIVVDSADLVQSRKLSYFHVDLDCVNASIAQNTEKSRMPVFNCIGYRAKALYEYLCGDILEREKSI